MSAAFYDGGRRDESQLRLFLKLRDGDSAAVAHGGFDLSAGLFDVFFQRTGIWDIGVYAFFESELLGTIEVITAPVSGTVGTFAPVFLDDGAADRSLLCRGFVEAGKVAAEHDEVSAHGKSQCDVVVVNDAAVGADRYVDAGSLVVFISGLAYFDESRCLAAADALGLTGDADGAAADADLDEVSACFCEEEEAFSVDDIACADLDFFAVAFTDPVDGDLLPFGEAFRGVDAEDICTCVYEERYAVCVVSGIDAGTDDEAFLCIEHFIRVFLMGVVVFAEYEAIETAVFIEDRQGIDLVVPDDVIRFGEGDAVIGFDKFFDRGHEVLDLLALVHAAYAVVSGGNDAYHFAVGSAVFRDGDGGVACLCLEGEDIR